MASLALSTRLRNTLTVSCCADSAGGYAVLSPLRQQRLRRNSLGRTVDGVVMSFRPQRLKKQPIGRIMRYHCKIRTAVGDCAEAIGTDWSTCSPPRGVDGVTGQEQYGYTRYIIGTNLHNLSRP